MLDHQKNISPETNYGRQCPPVKPNNLLSGKGDKIFIFSSSSLSFVRNIEMSATHRYGKESNAIFLNPE
jgi:hypothetical protein